VLSFDPDEKQCELLTAVQNGERRISARSGHGVGKTTGLALCIVCFALTRFPQKTVATAPTAKQLFEALAADTKALFKRLPPELLQLFDIKSESIHLAAAPEESFVSFRTSNPETPEALAGVHSENVLLIGDEASGIPEQVFEAAFGSMSGHNATTLLAGNPVRTSGLFFDTHHKLRDLWHTIHISCVGHPRITAGLPRRRGAPLRHRFERLPRPRAGRVPQGRRRHGHPSRAVEAAYNRDVKPLHVKDIWGLDCGRYGSDSKCPRR
jgi:phage terminase large subunit